jgi:zinc transporter ZupT
MHGCALPLGTAAAVVLLGNALATHDWLLALPLACFVFAGLVLLVPGASAHPDPARAAEDNARVTGEGSR